MVFPASARWWLAGLAVVSLAVGSTIAADRSSSAMSTAATKFLAGLTPEQRQKAALPFQGDERFKWHFVPAPPTFERQGILIKDMSEAQRKLAHDLSNALEIIVQTSYLLSTVELKEPATDWLRMLESGVQKALDIKQKALEADPGKKNADANKQMAAFYNNLGKADAQLGKTDDAVKAYNQAAQLDPAGAAQYYFNLGAILTNGGKVDEAIVAFDKSIAADPTKAAGLIAHST